MPSTNELWYIRFPDGRILRAVGVHSIRQQLLAGRLPPGTRLRKSLDEEWRPLERWPEFADFSIPANGAGRREQQGSHTPAPATIASRLDPAQLRQMGVRGYLEDLLAALDGTAVPCKVEAALLAGLLLGVLLAASRSPHFTFSLDPIGWGWALAGSAVVVMGGLTGILSRTSYAELSRLRPARWKDGLAGMGSLTLRLSIAFALVGGAVLGLISILRWLPTLLALHGTHVGEPAWSVAARVAAVLAVFCETLLWMVLPLLLPLGALLVVEECSVLSGLWQWMQLVRKRPGRLLVAEGMALSIALVLSLPLWLLMSLISQGSVETAFADTVTQARAVVLGILLALPLAYVLVANVFIYLNLRYQLAR